MEKPTPRPDPAYPGEMTDANIRSIFDGAGDFNARELKSGQWTLYAYAIDGLTSGGDASEYVIKPIAEQLRGDSMESLYRQALQGVVLFGGFPLRQSGSGCFQVGKRLLRGAVSGGGGHWI